ncbi:hypothetical protein JCM11491_002637 [Sporobolomyces phaffii]
MSRQRSHRDSLEDSDTSSFDSNEQLTDLEEAGVPEHPADQGRKKRVWVMRSGPSRTKSNAQRDYAPVAGDDQLDVDKPSGLDYGDDGTYPDDDYSTAEKGRKKSAASGSPETQGDYSDAENEEHDDEPKAQDPYAQDKKSNKKIWIYVGIAAIVLLLILLGVYFLWLRSKPKDDGKSSASSSSSSPQPAVASPISSALHLSSQAPVTTLPVLNATLATSQTLSPVSSDGTRPVASSHVRPNPTPTTTAQDSSTTFFAQITWFNDEGIATACGSHPNDGDYVVRISEELYGDSDSVSPLCGKWISLYQLETDSYTKATVEGICTSCTGNNIDLSRATFWALTQNMKLGTTLAQWWWTGKGDAPKNTLESQAPVAHATTKARPAVDSKSNSTSVKPISYDGFEPVDEPESIETTFTGGRHGGTLAGLSDVDA